MTDTANGGGYGNPGESVQSAQQAQAQQGAAAESAPSPVAEAAVDGTGVGLHNQSEAFRTQTQIGYTGEEE